MGAHTTHKHNQLHVRTCMYVCVCVCMCCIFQATAGLLADARNVVDRAKDEASSYRGVYSEAIPVKVSSLVSMLD